MDGYRLGVPVKVLGAALRSHDSRRWQQQPHLSVSLAYLRDLLLYLQRRAIHFYRLAGQLAPYATHPDLPQFHGQIEACSTELAALGDLARQAQIRLTLHPAHYVLLSSPDPARVARATAELALADQLLDAMGLGSEAVIVVHAGGGYGDLEAGRARFARVYDRLPPGVRRRLALENDDRLYSMADLHWIHQRTGVRLVLDVLHHRCNGGGEPLHEALLQALATWPAQERPKIHFSSPRTELRHITRQGQAHLLLPQPNQHSDFVHPFEFIDFLRSARGATSRAFDIMVEAKAKDLAVLRLREQLAAYAPDLASVVR